LHNSPPNGGYEKFRSGKQAAGETLPIWLQDAGYRTVWFGKFMNHYPGTRDRFDVPAGFTDWYGLFEGPFAGVSRSVYRQTSYAVRVKADRPALDGRRAHQVVDVGEGDGGQVWIYRGERNHQTEVLMDGAIRAIAQHDGSTPLYLTVSLTAPHSGGDAPAIGGSGYQTRTRPVTTRPARPELQRLRSVLARGGGLGVFGLDRSSSFNERRIADKPAWFRQQPRLTAEDIEDVEIRNALRRASLQSVDRRIPDLLSAIQAADRRTGRKSYVVLTSDNGFFLGEHRLGTEKNWHYGAATDVPLVISGPRVARDATVGAAVANVDLAPTIVAMAGVGSVGKIDGRSLLPLLEHPSSAGSARWRDRAVLLQGRWGGSSTLRYAAARTSSHVYVEHYAQRDGVTVEFVELYNRVRDSGYGRNLLHGRASPQARTIARELAGVLDQLKTCAGAPCRDHQHTQPAPSNDAPRAGQGSRRERSKDTPSPATIGPPLEFGSSEPASSAPRSSDPGQEPSAPEPEPSAPRYEPRPAPAPGPPAKPPNDTLFKGETLGPNGRLESRNGKYTLVMQEDGNLVVYRNGVLPGVWSSGTHGHDGERAYLVVQNDGNVVIYNRDRALWATGTHGRTNTKLIMQDNGVLGAWAEEGPVWRSH
jgi:N-acetylglucosamine-6-sulfatase